MIEKQDITIEDLVKDSMRLDWIIQANGSICPDTDGKWEVWVGKKLAVHDDPRTAIDMAMERNSSDD